MKDIASIISELEQQRSAIDRAISALREVTGTRSSTSSLPAASQQGPATKKRRISPEGRARIAKAMRRRWAAKRAAEQGGPSGQTSRTGRNTATTKKAATKKRRLSPEGRARIIEATRRRWAAKRAAEQNSGSQQGAAGGRKRAIKTTGQKAAKKAAVPSV